MSLTFRVQWCNSYVFCLFVFDKVVKLFLVTRNLTKAGSSDPCEEAVSSLWSYKSCTGGPRNKQIVHMCFYLFTYLRYEHGLSSFQSLLMISCRFQVQFSLVQSKFNVLQINK